MSSFQLSRQPSRVQSFESEGSTSKSTKAVSLRLVRQAPESTAAVDIGARELLTALLEWYREMLLLEPDDASEIFRFGPLSSQPARIRIREWRDGEINFVAD